MTAHSIENLPLILGAILGIALVIASVISWSNRVYREKAILQGEVANNGAGGNSARPTIHIALETLSKFTDKLIWALLIGVVGLVLASISWDDVHGHNPMQVFQCDILQSCPVEVTSDQPEPQAIAVSSDSETAPIEKKSPDQEYLETNKKLIQHTLDRAPFSSGKRPPKRTVAQRKTLPDAEPTKAPVKKKKTSEDQVKEAAHRELVSLLGFHTVLRPISNSVYRPKRA